MKTWKYSVNKKHNMQSILVIFVLFCFNGISTTKFVFIFNTNIISQFWEYISISIFSSFYLMNNKAKFAYI